MAEITNEVQMDNLIKKLIKEATEDFQSPYWQRALDMRPPPLAELNRLVYNGRVSTCKQNSQAVLTITNEGKLEFVTNGRSEVDLQVNQLFIRLEFEQFMKPNKNVMITAERTRIIHTLDNKTVDTQELQFISSDKISSNEYLFRIPEGDNLDNCRLCTYYDIDSKCPTYYLDYDSGGVRIGAQQSRYNLQTIGKIIIHK